MRLRQGATRAMQPLRPPKASCGSSTIRSSKESSRTSWRTSSTVKYPTYLTIDRASSYTLRLFKDLKLAKTTRSRSGGRLRHADGLYNIEQAGRSALERSQLRLGRRPRGHGGPGRSPEPAHRALDGHLRRRRDPRHQRRRIARQRRLARLHPHAMPDVIELYDQVEVGTPIYISSTTTAGAAASTANASWLHSARASPSSRLAPGAERAHRASDARGVSANTKRAYRADLSEFALWASERDLEAARSTTASCAATRRRSRARRRQVDRGEQARRGAQLLRPPRRHGRGPEPGRAAPSPKRESRLPRVLGARRSGRCSSGFPAAPRWTARPGDARARLLVRAALRGDRPRRRRRRLRESTARDRQGGQDAHGPGRGAGPARRALRRAARPALEVGEQGRDAALFLSRRGRRLSPSDVRRRLALWVARPPSPAASRRMRCATPSRPTCSRAARTCARSRSCSATRASRRPRSTPGRAIAAAKPVRVEPIPRA